MTMWCNLPTITNWRYALRFAGLIAIFVAITTTILFASVSNAAQSTTKTVNFQGRLLSASGAVVPDGYYNMQFKIYQDGAGTAVGNPGGTLKWTETYINDGGTDGVFVKNGVFSVSLGSVNPFGSSVDWDQDSIWLSMNVAGSATACTSFNSAPCAADGEMLPMRRIGATPYAINSGAVGGKTATDLLQLAQGVQTDASSNTSSIFINKTGSGNLVQLQNTATDVFTVSNTGNLTLGSNANKSLTIATSSADTDGRELTIAAGNGGSGSGADGGDLVLQGGSAGGTDGDGGDARIDAGVANGSGASGRIAIGETNAGSISIGSSSVARDQVIDIGANNTAGSSSTVTIGSGGSASSGSTTIQAKDSVTIKTNGITRATFSDNSNTVYFGNGVSSSTPSDATIQGTDSSATAVAGGSLTVQGGNATTGNADGGNLVLSGGNGSGSGANGLVVLETPAFSTVTNDSNCYTSGTVVASSCTITNSTVDSSSAVIVGFSATGQTATLPDPTITTAGRILYVMAAGNSKDFTLSLNGGSTGNLITMRQNTAATLLWNGSDWISAGASNSTTLQDVYNNTPQSAGGTELFVGNEPNANGLTIRDSTADPVDTTLLDVQNSSASSLFSINSKTKSGTEYVTDGDINDGSDWFAVGSASVSRITSDGVTSGDSIQVSAGTTANAGVGNILANNPQTNTLHRVSFSAKLTAGSNFNDILVTYSPDNGSTPVNCANYSTRKVVSSGWTEITCYITTGATSVTEPELYISQPTSAASARTFLIDNVSFAPAPGSNSNVKVGNDAGGDDATLFTLDKSASAPTSTDSNALLGSMYYDTTSGKVQCYEAEGWGNCGASPDNFITISPEYTNAVMNGTDIGTITSDLCSDTLNINDGSSSQPTICGTNETYNFYKWTSAESGDQTRSIYVTYQLPSTFKNFVTGSTSLKGRTDSNNSSVTYQVYRDNGSGLTSCGSTIPTSTGSQSTWQSALADNDEDPSDCDFEPGDSILFRINLTAKSNANAYVSNLDFTFSNN